MLRPAVLLSWIVAASACAASAPVPEARPDPPVEVVSPAEQVSCPLGVEGARVVVEDVDGGVTLTFTSMAGIEQLRERTRRAAEMHGPEARQGLGHHGAHRQGGPVHHGLQAFLFPPARVTVEDVDAGARMRIAAVFPSDVERIRAKARERANAMMACR